MKGGMITMGRGSHLRACMTRKGGDRTKESRKVERRDEASFLQGMDRWAGCDSELKLIIEAGVR
jgi:uncharacterized protein YaiI (UPF0178 family)